jgi:hypothetical protein
MPYQQIILLFILQTAMALFTTSSCPAYIEVTNVKHPIKMITAHTDDAPALFSYHLIWSDNEEYHQHFEASFSAVHNPSNHYIFAFSMPVLETVTQQKGAYVPSDFNIDNLLYANLELDRLLSEYEKLKERSKLILEGLDIPYISRPPGSGFQSNINELPISHQIDTVNNHISILAGPVVSHTRTTDSTNYSYNPQLGKHYGRSKQLHSKRQPLNYLSNSRFKRKPNVKNQSEQNDAASSGSHGTGTGAIDRLPLIERIGKSLVDYIKANKIEFIFYFVLLFGLCNMLYRIRR